MLSDAELQEMADTWHRIAMKRETQAGKLAREGSAQASAYSSGVSAGMQVAANDLRSLLKGRKPL
jgi:hypothetical protein